MTTSKRQRCHTSENCGEQEQTFLGTPPSLLTIIVTNLPLREEEISMSLGGKFM